MAYVLGFLYADGNIVKTKRNTHFVAFYSADELLLKSIKKVLESEHMLSKRNSISGEVYRLQVGSKEWYGDLFRLGLTPGKTYRMHLPPVPKKYWGDFLRGYFDGDGNVWVGHVHTNRPVSTLTIQTSFTSGSIEFLAAMRDKLLEEGLVGGSLFKIKEKNYGRLTFSKRDTLKIYRIMYNPPHKLYLKRKKVVFERFEKDCGCKRNLSSAALER